ncbi:MAG: thioredoxin-disulfide reductase [Burkholderiales bacterium]
MYDLIIAGAGTAGLTAGIYAARAGMSALIIESLFAGGQIARAHIVENYPGFPEGVSGAELALKFREQAERLGARIENAQITGFELEGGEKKVLTQDAAYSAKTVILAMGANYKSLGLMSEKKLVGSGVSYCATCDGAFFKRKDVAVVGGGDTALEDALYLSGFANHIYVIHRRDELRAQKALQKTAMANEKIEFVWDSVVETVLGKSFVEGVRIKNTKTEQLRDISVSGVFVAIGTTPQTEIVKGKVDIDESGYIITDAFMRTSVPGVFAAGDIVKKPLRQVVTAAADGAVAVYSALSYLREK